MAQNWALDSQLVGNYNRTLSENYEAAIWGNSVNRETGFVRVVAV